MVRIPDWIVSKAVFFSLAVLSMYFIAAYGESLRKRGYRGIKNVGYAFKNIVNDTQMFIKGLGLIFFAVFAVLSPLNIGAGLAALTAWASYVWFFFVNLVMSVMNIVGVTSYTLAQIIAFASIAFVASIVLRWFMSTERSPPGF